MEKIILKFNEVEKIIEVDETFIKKNNLLDNMCLLAEEENCEEDDKFKAQFRKNELEFKEMVIELIQKNFNTQINRQNFFYLTYLPREEQIRRNIQFRIKAKDYVGGMNVSYSHSEMLELIEIIKQKIKKRFNDGY